MFTRTFFVCLFLTLHNEGLSLSCKWMDHKFKQFSENSLDLLDTMGSNFTEDTATVSFPRDLYKQASNASSEDQIGFIAQVVEEMTDLFEKNLTSVSWEQSGVDNFLNVMTQQGEGLRSCIVGQKKKNKKLQMYFKRLSRNVLERMGHSAEAWELIRKEIKIHLLRVDLLASATFKTI